MADSIGRRIPLRLSDLSVIDSEFSSIRERFDAEMKKMEEEMNKFRSELMNRESSLTQRSATSSRMESSRSEFHSSGSGSVLPDSLQSMLRQQEASSITSSTSSNVADTGAHRTWLDDLNSPLIQEDGQEKRLKLRFDVAQYEPEEIVVKTVDQKLMVHAKHEEKTENRSVYREYNREFLLPKGTNPELIKSSLSKDGVLTVEAPLPAIAGEKFIAIDQK